MTNTQKLIEEISKLNGHMFECGDFEGLMDKVREVAEAAKAERAESQGFTKRELEQLLALLELTLHEDLLDNLPLNYDHLPYELSDRVSKAWKSLSLIDKVKTFINNHEAK